MVKLETQRRVRKVLNNYTEEDLKKALHEIRDNKMAIRKACRTFNVPKMTILYRISGRVPDQSQKPGLPPLLTVQGENRVKEWTWYKNFMKRNPEVSLREAEGINKARAIINKESIRKWFKELTQFLTERNLLDLLDDPHRIFNGDESGFALYPKSGKILGPKGFRNLYHIKLGNEKENITSYSPVRLPRAVVEGMPSNWVLGNPDKGWMTSEVFFEYIANDFHKWARLKNTRPIIVFDGHKSHMMYYLGRPSATRLKAFSLSGFYKSRYNQSKQIGFIMEKASCLFCGEATVTSDNLMVKIPRIPELQSILKCWNDNVTVKILEKKQDLLSHLDQYFYHFSCRKSIVSIMFDRYDLEYSTKNSKRERRGIQNNLNVYSIVQSRTVPNNKNFLRSPANEKALLQFVTDFVYKSSNLVPHGREVRNDSCIELPELKSNHEEADTRILFHISSSNTIENEIHMEADHMNVTTNKKRYGIPIYALPKKLGQPASTGVQRVLSLKLGKKLPERYITKTVRQLN
ncbi:unnamed protein product [Ceutorhynchus assimilis]|uniref:HTH psq-type domain-containing protein n=1 Tax=Ceutorhynchus assimilis TaxID=467358 RepID=A0A9N9Q8N8_9CUCU|nr:unnamed protein product [Ceutorhynchus assimilis]